MSDISSINGDIFQEPEGYFQPEKPFTYQSYTLNDGREIDVRLVGQNPLWGHLLWNGALTLSTQLQTLPQTNLIVSRTILELGAGAGLPSLVCAVLGASKVLVTDYPDADLIANLAYNISHCPYLTPGVMSAAGYVWGGDVEPLLAHLPEGESGFDTLILADLLFNHSEHGKLVRSMRLLLKREQEARALVWFTPYRPWLLEKDLAFFELVRESNKVVEGEGSDLGQSVIGRLEVQKVMEKELERVMFVEDPGDERLRRTVFGFEVLWGDLQDGE